jgi:hypothetical protein
MKAVTADNVFSDHCSDHAVSNGAPEGQPFVVVDPRSEILVPGRSLALIRDSEHAT